MAETLKLTLDTGVMDFEIVDHKGEPLGVVRFNPTNTEIITRLEQMIENINSADFRAQSDEEDNGDYIKRLNDSLRSGLDSAIGAPVSSVFFATIAPLSMTTDDDTYFERVLETIGGVLEKYTNRRISKKLQKLEKAKAKYKNR